MAQDLEVLLYGHPGLREKSAPVVSFDDALRDLAARMQRSMILERGVGLAAPQVGEHVRMILAEDDRSGRTQTLTLINPEFVQASREQDAYNEGCLSLPELFADVRRPVEVTVRYQDLDGVEHELTDDGFLARIIQHEYDHLEGVLFVDHLSALKRKLLARKLRAFQERAIEQQERGV